jgi:hypothetical protein
MEFVLPLDPNTLQPVNEAYRDRSPGQKGHAVQAKAIEHPLKEITHVIDYFLGDGSPGSGTDVADLEQLRKAIQQAVIDGAADTTLTPEEVQDIVGAFMSGQGVTVVYDDAGNAISINLTYATNAETQAGAIGNKPVSPASLSSRTATTTRTGLVEKATEAEAIGGTADKYPDAALIKQSYLQRIGGSGVGNTLSNIIHFVEESALYRNTILNGALQISLSTDVLPLGAFLTFDIVVTGRANGTWVYKVYSVQTEWDQDLKQWTVGVTTVECNVPKDQMTVRFHDSDVDDKAHIYIGETSTSWLHPLIFVRNLTSRGGSAENGGDEKWLSAFTCDIVPTFAGTERKIIAPPNGNLIYDFTGLGPHTVPQLDEGVYKIDVTWLPTPYQGAGTNNNTMAGLNKSPRPSISFNTSYEGAKGVALANKDSILLIVSEFPANSNVNTRPRLVYSFRRFPQVQTIPQDTSGTAVAEEDFGFQQGVAGQGEMTFDFPATTPQSATTQISSIVPESVTVKISQLS